MEELMGPIQSTHLGLVWREIFKRRKRGDHAGIVGEIMSRSDLGGGHRHVGAPVGQQQAARSLRERRLRHGR